MVSNTDIFGRKVFFIATNNMLVPPSFMEDFCTLGYEAHIISGGSDMHSEVISIVSQFPDSILFFNADSDEIKTAWTTLIKEVKQERDNLLVGTVFKSAEDEHAQHVEHFFGNDVSSQVGCVALSSVDKEENFRILKDVLDRCGAKGRRNNIRALCDKSSHILFNFEGHRHIERIEDVNISHFRCTSTSDDFHNIKIYDKIRNANITINGLEFKSDAVLIMKRKKEGISTAIFMFIRKPDDEPGLESEFESQLNKKIYQITSQEFINLLHR